MLTSPKFVEARLGVKGRMKISSAVAAAAALVAAFAPVASSGGETQHARASACPGSAWPGTAMGKPAALTSAATGSAFYVWADRGAWHIRVKGSAATPLAARLSTSTRLRVLSVTAGLRPALNVSSRSVSFRAGAGGMEGVDFSASCARQVGFAFGSATSGVAAAPRIFLGARGQSPAPAFDLARPATTGVAGSIIVGPTCPAIGPGANCPPAQHVQGTVRIETAASSRGGPGGGQLVKTVESSAQGSFTADLAPGRYLLSVEKSDQGLPVPKPSVVNVQAGVVSRVVLVLDTGIR